jgi:hypothetical protein
MSSDTVTRDEVIQRAKTYINISGWAPANDTVRFPEMSGNPKFTSCFRKDGQDKAKKVCTTYNVVPYVFGGFDDVSKFLSRIQRNDTAPGGWDRTTGRVTKFFAIPRKGKSPKYIAKRRLAGIDCSGYVSKCWKLRRKRGTVEIPDYFLEINKSNLKKGDVLNKKGHVVIFEKWTGKAETSAYVYESRGRGHKRAFREGDTRGHVIHRTRTWNELKSGNFIPYSPFPQLKTIKTDENGISARCEGSGELEIQLVSMDGTSNPFKVSKQGALPKGKNGNFKEVTPQISLPRGEHTIQISAINSAEGVSFRDNISLEFELS